QQDLTGELSEGRALLEEVRDLANGAADPVTAGTIDAALAVMDHEPLSVLGDEFHATVVRYERKEGLTTLGPFPVRVDRELARFGAWYELFPRSWGGFAGVQAQLPQLAELGFNVVYFPPIHPIGMTNRKGADNAQTAAAGDPGSPYAVGDESGGHEAIHRELGTEADLRRLTAAAAELGIDIALDLALTCSPDHPWLKSHPEWFNHRPDGTLKYAENPPKRYQDIYNFNWDCDDWRGLWEALLEVVLHWVDCGVKVFRVDNPHTKPAPFWEWLINKVHRKDQTVIFLAEAFTRRAVMRHLAKVGFSQSYTYFTWKNTRSELIEYVSELALTEESEYFRPNFFVNTPDILHEYLQLGGRGAFEARLVLAATLSPSYGIYSGFENLEATPLHAGSEEYLHSEKYEIKDRKLDGPLLPMIGLLNAARRDNPALQRFENITFLDSGNDQLLAYAKQSAHNTVIVVVNLDPHNEQIGLVLVPAHLGLPPVFGARDWVGSSRYEWRLGGNYVKLGPGRSHLLRIEPAV
ncbi:MAG: alpha-amylase family glycosyl hydrolase, partial [Solirubrobacteraceae bacterium]